MIVCPRRASPGTKNWTEPPGRRIIFVRMQVEVFNIISEWIDAGQDFLEPALS